jgi:hypothetical protein
MIDIEDNKTDLEKTQVSAVHDQERLAEEDERAQKSWLYRVWVRSCSGCAFKHAKVTDHILVPDNTGLRRRLLYPRHVQCHEWYWRRR